MGNESREALKGAMQRRRVAPKQVYKDETIEDVLIDDIDSPPFHDRSYVSEEGVRELAENIKNVGYMIEPIVVRRSENGRYERIVGYRRLLAAKLLNWERVQAKVISCSREEAILMMISENIEREDLNPYDKIYSILQYLAVNMGMETSDMKSLLFRIKNYYAGNVSGDDSLKEKIEKIKELLTKFKNIKLSSFLTKLKALSFDPVIVSAMREKNLSFSNAVELNKLRNHRVHMEAFLTLVLDGDISGKELKEKVKEVLRKENGDFGSEQSEIVSKKARNLFKISKLKKLPPQKLKEIDDLLRRIENVLGEES
jgi:ParB family chromosome partitioning protein